MAVVRGRRSTPVDRTLPLSSIAATVYPSVRAATFAMNCAVVVVVVVVVAGPYFFRDLCLENESFYVFGRWWPGPSRYGRYLHYLLLLMCIFLVYSRVHIMRQYRTVQHHAIEWHSPASFPNETPWTHRQCNNHHPEICSVVCLRRKHPIQHQGTV